MSEYRELWEEKSGKAPKESVIAGLQKLLNQKQDTIIEMDAKMQALKARVIEYNEILTEMEKEYKKQQTHIQELEGDGATGSYSSTSVMGSGGDQDKVRQLQNKLNEMQNKLFIYSNLPSRISVLEEKLEEKDEVIDEYFDKVENLRKRLNTLNEDDGAKKVIEDLERKLEQQNQLIKELRQKGPRSSAESSFNRNNEMSDKLNVFRIENEELKKQLVSAQETIQSLQNGSSGGTMSTNMNSNELNAENNRLKQQIQNLNNQIKEKDVKLEEIIEKVQKGDTAGAVLAGSNELKELEVKVERLRAENKRLKEQIGVEKAGTSIGTGPRPPTLRPTAPKIREISTGAPTDTADSSEKLSELQKQVAEKEMENKKLNNELISSQTELAKMKAQGPAQDGQGNVMELLQDLQTKIRKLKGVVKQKDAQIAQLQKNNN